MDNPKFEKPKEKVPEVQIQPPPPWWLISLKQRHDAEFDKVLRNFEKKNKRSPSAEEYETMKEMIKVNMPSLGPGQWHVPPGSPAFNQTDKNIYHTQALPKNPDWQYKMNVPKPPLVNTSENPIYPIEEDEDLPRRL